MKLKIIFALLSAAGGANPIQGQAQILPAEFWSEPSAPDAAPPPADLEGWDDEEPPPQPRRVCHKLCANDFSPCDPLYFKTEDGRCDGLDLGR